MAELTYLIDGSAVTKRVSDVGEGGLFVDTPVPSEVGTQLKVRFVLDGEVVEAEGKVAYAQPFIGMGVEFLRISPEHREVVRRFVARMVEPVTV
jgi:hypothetical protein